MGGENYSIGEKLCIDNPPSPLTPLLQNLLYISSLLLNFMIFGSRGRKHLRYTSPTIVFLVVNH